MAIIDLEEIYKFQRKFAAERDWEQFHTPKNLAMALAGEAGELLEIFQWLTSEQSHQVMQDPAKKVEVCDELADIFYYLLRLCDKLDVDLPSAFSKKISKNAKKYPADLVRGSAKKYTEYQLDQN